MLQPARPPPGEHVICAVEGNRLLVQTNRYTATYPRFLTSEEPPIGVIFP